MKRLTAFLLIAVFALGDASGPRSGTGAGGSWTNPANATISDNAYATCSILPADACAGALTLTTLGFALPSTATVTGIEVLYEKKCSVSGCTTNTANGGQVILTGCTGTSTNNGEGMSWTTSDTTTTLGNSADMWGLTCTYTQVNSSAFGVSTIVANANAISSRTASIDYIAVTVYYSTSGASSRRRVIVSQTRSLGVPHA